MTHEAIIFPSQAAKLEVTTVDTLPLPDTHVKIAVDYVAPSPLEIWRGHMGLVSNSRRRL